MNLADDFGGFSANSVWDLTVYLGTSIISCARARSTAARREGKA